MKTRLFYEKVDCFMKSREISFPIYDEDKRQGFTPLLDVGQ